MANLHLTAGDEYQTTAGYGGIQRRVRPMLITRHFRWYEEGFVDDQIWVQAMGTLHFLNEQRGKPKTENQRVLWQ